MIDPDTEPAKTDIIVNFAMIGYYDHKGYIGSTLDPLGRQKAYL